MNKRHFLWVPALAGLLLFAKAQGQCGPPQLFGSTQVVGSPTPTSLVPRTEQTISFTLRNTGTSTWYPGDDVDCDEATYVMMERVSPAPGGTSTTDDWLPQRVPLKAVVQPGGEYTFQFKVSPPASAANRTFTVSYRMVRPFCTWGFPINGPFSKFDISTCAAYGGFSAFSGTFPNWTISVG